MKKENLLSRRRAIRFLAAGLGAITGLAGAAEQRANIGAMLPGQGWIPADQNACPGDGTPLQFLPKTPPDAEPLHKELEKYPRCPYCGMSRSKFHASRHLVQYDDNLVDGTCSIHCLAISLSLNLDRGPKAIYAADYGSKRTPKALVNIDQSVYLIGSGLKATMAGTSKVAFSNPESARQIQARQGGELGDFDQALLVAYQDMAKDTAAIRKRRLERRKHMGGRS